MTEENNIINEYLTPILSELMTSSLNTIRGMKEKNEINKENSDFIKQFLSEALEFYSDENSAHIRVEINEIMQYLVNYIDHTD